MEKEEEQQELDLQTQFDLLSRTFSTLSKQLQERLEIVKEKENMLKEVDEKMKQNAALAKTKIKLDIGGKIFAASKSTLLAFEGSYFHSMLSSNNWKPDEDGCYFIDRNPKYFSIILDYMRTGKIDLSGYPSNQLDRLNEELDYYQIKLPPVVLEIKSTILNDTMKSHLVKMLPPNAKKFRLILTSSQGTGTTVFDNAVKGFANTLIIIKATTGYVFGAYVVDKWFSGSSWIKGNLETFLFSFGNGQTPPVKLLHSGNGNGIHISGCGLHLGDTGDLVAFCSHTCTKPATYTVVAPGYQGTLDCNLLAGASSWTPTFMEVFVLE